MQDWLEGVNRINESVTRRGGKEEERREGRREASLMEKCCLGQFLCRSLEDAIFAADWSKSDRGQPWGERGELRIMNTFPFSQKRLTCTVLTSDPKRHLCISGIDTYLISCGSISPFLLVTSVLPCLHPPSPHPPPPSLQGGPFFLWDGQCSPRMPASLILLSLHCRLLLCSSLPHPNCLFLIPNRIVYIWGGI